MSIKLALSEHFIQSRRGKKAPTVFLEPHPADKSFKVTLLMHNSGIFLFFFIFLFRFISFHFISVTEAMRQHILNWAMTTIGKFNLDMTLRLVLTNYKTKYSVLKLILYWSQSLIVQGSSGT